MSSVSPGMLGLLSLVMFLASLIAVPLLVARMPADFFVAPAPQADSWRGRHPALRAGLAVGKSLLGVLVVLAGAAMMVLPGQGILTILIGLTFIDFPGKRRFQCWLIRRPSVSRSVAWIRRKANRPPLELPPLSG